MTSVVQLGRVAGRLALLGVAACVAAVIGMQFEGIVVKNMALYHALAASRADIAALRAHAQDQRQTIVRLGDPHGAIPEIHDRLQLVGPHEEMIYVRGLADPSPSPDDWNPPR